MDAALPPVTPVESYYIMAQAVSSKLKRGPKSFFEKQKGNPHDAGEAALNTTLTTQVSMCQTDLKT